MPPRPLKLSLALISATIIAGLAMRFAPLGLPPLVVKYGGSTLWALMLYWVASTLFPSTPLTTVALLAGTVATAVEFLKLYHAAALDAFRLTFLGILLLGRFFSYSDILAYWLAICAGLCLDKILRRPTIILKK
jgi:hypothetical protein